MVSGDRREVFVTYFHELADSSPEQLLTLVRGGMLPDYELTYAAEALGRVQDARCRCMAAALLLRAARHTSPLVREGAAYGLAQHLWSGRVEIALRRLQTDVSEGVRAAATDGLTP